MESTRDKQIAPVTFKSKAYANILMFGDVATKMLEMMKFGSSIPGAIDTDDVPAALQNLERALASVPESVDDSDEDQPAVSLHTRAMPLLELLRATIADETFVRWE